MWHLGALTTARAIHLSLFFRNFCSISCSVLLTALLSNLNIYSPFRLQTILISKIIENLCWYGNHQRVYDWAIIRRVRSHGGDVYRRNFACTPLSCFHRKSFELYMTWKIYGSAWKCASAVTQWQNEKDKICITMLAVFVSLIVSWMEGSLVSFASKDRWQSRGHVI